MLNSQLPSCCSNLIQHRLKVRSFSDPSPIAPHNDDGWKWTWKGYEVRTSRIEGAVVEGYHAHVVHVYVVDGQGGAKPRGLQSSPRTDFFL